MRVVALIWVIGSLVFSIVATFMDIEPAYTIKEAATQSDGSFYVVLPIGLTFLICMAPLLVIFFIHNRIVGNKNKVPDNLTGKTGIIIQRERELQNGALMYGVYINNEQTKKVAMGRKIFIELPVGNYQLQIKGTNKMVSAVVPFELTEGKILAFSTKADLGKSLTTLIPKGEMLFLVQIPYVSSR